MSTNLFLRDYEVQIRLKGKPEDIIELTKALSKALNVVSISPIKSMTPEPYSHRFLTVAIEAKP